MKTFHGKWNNLSADEDIIDETLNFFKANVFFKNFEINGNADRLLIYLTLYTTDCIVKLQKVLELWLKKHKVVPFYFFSSLFLQFTKLFSLHLLNNLSQSPNKNQALKDMYSLSISRFFLPGEAQFPLNAVYTAPQGHEAGELGVV